MSAQRQEDNSTVVETDTNVDTEIFDAFAVFPCDTKQEAPYDFGTCETHDRTFAIGADCDHSGLSLIDYLDKKLSEQRFRAVKAEDSKGDMEYYISELHKRAVDHNESCNTESDCTNCLNLCSECNKSWPCPTISIIVKTT